MWNLHIKMWRMWRRCEGDVRLMWRVSHQANLRSLLWFRSSWLAQTQLQVLFCTIQCFHVTTTQIIQPQHGYYSRRGHRSYPTRSLSGKSPAVWVISYEWNLAVYSCFPQYNEFWKQTFTRTIFLGKIFAKKTIFELYFEHGNWINASSVLACKHL